MSPMKMPVLDCYSRAEDPVARALSNLAERPFTLDGQRYASMEGFLQSLKFVTATAQATLARLSGYEAWKKGQIGNVWQADQKLHYRGQEIPRESPKYDLLITRAYDAQYDQNPELRELLISTVGKRLRHTMGHADPKRTVLTEVEYIGQLNRLRWRALNEKRDAAPNN